MGYGMPHKETAQLVCHTDILKKPVVAATVVEIRNASTIHDTYQEIIEQ